MYPALDDVIACYDADGYVLLVNWRRGKDLPANQVVGRLWYWLEQGHGLQAALQPVADEYAVSVDELRRDIAPELLKLRQHGMLTDEPPRPRRAPVSVAFGGSPAPDRIAVTAVDQAVPLRVRVAVIIALGVATVLQRTRYEHMLRVMSAVRRLRSQHPTVTTTKQFVAIAWRFAYRHPGWSECHEITVTAFLAAALLGKAPTWCLGVGLDPFSWHTYLEVDGATAIDHSERFTRGHYRPVIQVRGRHCGGLAAWAQRVLMRRKQDAARGK